MSLNGLRVVQPGFIFLVHDGTGYQVSSASSNTCGVTMKLAERERGETKRKETAKKKRTKQKTKCLPESSHREIPTVYKVSTSKSDDQFLWFCSRDQSGKW